MTHSTSHCRPTAIGPGILVVVVALAGCRRGAPLPAPPPPPLPTYDQVWGVSAHNAYWVNRSDQLDWFSSGVQEHLPDQLLHEHVRAIELDLHSTNAPAGEWLVYHTSRAEDSLCRTLSDCLELVRRFQYAVPEHEVVNIVLELKNTDPLTNTDHCHGHGIGLCDGPHDLVTDRNFVTPGHTIDDLDAILRAHLGANLYTPADFLARCPAGLTMVACMARAGWPTIDQLRGKFIINVKGDWSNNVTDWVEYASADPRTRAAFSMAAIDGIDISPLPAPVDRFFDTVTPNQKLFRWFTYTPTLRLRLFNSEWAIPHGAILPAKMHAALDASVFWQVEDLGDDARTAIAEFRDRHGVLQLPEIYDHHPGCDDRPWDCQEKRIADRTAFLHTDYPWHVVGDQGPGIPTDPSQRLKQPGRFFDPPTASPPIHEPGARMYLHVPWPADAVYAVQDHLAYDGPSTFRYREVPATGTRWWETTVSTTRNGATWRVDPKAPSLRDNYASDYWLPCPGPTPAKLVGPAVLDLDATDPRNCSDFPRPAQANGEGCLRVASASGRDWLAVCRQKHSGGGADGGGASYFQEAVRIFVREVRDGVVVDRPIDPSGATPQFFSASRYGACATPGLPNSDDTYAHPQCVGDLIALAVDNRGADGSIVRVYSAGRLQPLPGDRPDWQLLVEARFREPMTRQGVSGSQDVLFVGTRTALAYGPDAPELRDVRLADLPGVSTTTVDWLEGWARGSTWRTFVADVTGDGKADAIAWRSGTDPASDPSSWQVAVSDGTRFVPTGGEWAHGWATGAYWRPFVADVTGDGKADLIVWNPGSDPVRDPGNWQVAVSDGTRFVPTGGEWAHGWATGAYWRPFVADVTGDGKADLIVWNPGGPSKLSGWQVAIARGDRFEPTRPLAVATVVDLSFP